MTVAARASVEMLAASAANPPVMPRPRLAPTRAVAAMFGSAPCSAPSTPNRGMARPAFTLP